MSNNASSQRSSQQMTSLAQPFENQSSGRSSMRRSKLLPTTTEGEETAEVYIEGCDGNFTLSGSNPPTTVGALSNKHGDFAKYARCGHWSSCKKNNCKAKKSFDPCSTCCDRAPYGPYGPWSKNGPAQFLSPKADYINVVFPHSKRQPRNGDQRRANQPMGRLAPWPLSGSCRFAGRPYGPCRPFGSFKSRGPFGFWTCQSDKHRPTTPMQPCWKSTKRGHRPCTPCHRPLFRPCKPSPT